MVVVKATGEKRAVKRIAKKMMATTVGNKKVIDLKPIEMEVELQRECCANAENIVKIFDVFDSGPIVDIVLEPMKKDDLFDAIETVYYPDGDFDMADCRYTELAASRIIKQVIAAVGACHQYQVCHRDLKPENILVHTYISDQEPVVKLCDFGLAAKVDKGLLSEACGTPEYVAPEVVIRNMDYGLPADIWSIGVMLFILLCGEQPFHSDREGQAGTKDVLDQVKKHKIGDKFAENPLWPEISDSAKDLLINGMLDRNPSKRLTVEQLLVHPWVTGEAAPKTPMANALLANHRMYLRRKFRTAIHVLVATNRIRALIHGLKADRLVEDGLAALTIESNYDSLLDSFILVAPRDHGMVSSATFSATLAKHAIATGNEKAHFDAFCEDYGSDGEAHVNFRDYVISLAWRCSSTEEIKMKFIFKVFDLDHDGEIDHDEFVLLINQLTMVGKNERKPLDESSKLFSVIDSNGNYRIDEGEFMEWAQTVSQRHCQCHTATTRPVLSLSPSLPPSPSLSLSLSLSRSPSLSLSLSLARSR